MGVSSPLLFSGLWRTELSPRDSGGVRVSGGRAWGEAGWPWPSRLQGQLGTAWPVDSARAAQVACPRRPGRPHSGQRMTPPPALPPGGTVTTRGRTASLPLLPQPGCRCRADGAAGGLLDGGPTRRQEERRGEEGPAHRQKHAQVHLPVPAGQQAAQQWRGRSHAHHVHDSGHQGEEQEG